MSRIGKRPINIGTEVQIKYQNRDLSIKGPKGELRMKVHPEVALEVSDHAIRLQPAIEKLGITPMLGTTWALVRNMVHGVTEGFVNELNLVGVGYRASVQQRMLVLNLGFSHPIEYPIPDGVMVKVTGNTTIVIESADKQLLGQVAADIRKYRPPEPYKGKGILFKGERLKRKAGKAGKV